MPPPTVTRTGKVYGPALIRGCELGEPCQGGVFVKPGFRADDCGEDS